MKIKQRNGISLIVLVITIIVMIILAAAIILSLQSSGIIGRANEASTKSDEANAKNVVALANAEWQLDEAKIRTENNVTTFKQYAEKMLQEAGFKVGGNGGISLSDSGAINTVYIDKNNKQVTIPEGFTVSSVSTEKTVADGLVIIDGKGNEFVWVPVEVPADKTFAEVFIKTPSAYTEPYSTTGYTEEVEEFNKMKASVEENNGFYIARYEAGKGENNTVLSKKGAEVWNNIPWGTDMTTIGTSGAVYKSRQMYSGSNSVTSTLCYGVQWDAVMEFMKDVPNPNVSGKKYIEDSTSMGYYAYDINANPIEGMEAVAQPTGYYAVKNIYDMAGNVFEWTMEVKYTSTRVIRGGYFGYSGDFASASYRDKDFFPTLAFGFRVALYLK